MKLRKEEVLVIVPSLNWLKGFIEGHAMDANAIEHIEAIKAILGAAALRELCDVD